MSNPRWERVGSWWSWRLTAAKVAYSESLELEAEGHILMSPTARDLCLRWRELVTVSDMAAGLVQDFNDVEARIYNHHSVHFKCWNCG